VQALDDALIGFVWLVRRIVPPSTERDDALAGFDDLRQMLASLPCHSLKEKKEHSRFA